MATIKIKKSEFQKLYKVACDGWKTKFNEKFKHQLFDDELEFEESFIEEMEKACDSSRPEQLKTLKSIFKAYIKENIFSQIRNYSDVCKALKIKELTISDFKAFGEEAKKMLAFHKIKNIEKLFNETWKPNFIDGSQYKYYPYFTANKNGGLGFGDCSCYYSGFCGRVGLFKDSKTATFVGKTFTDIYQDLI